MLTGGPDLGRQESGKEWTAGAEGEVKSASPGMYEWATHLGKAGTLTFLSGDWRLSFLPAYICLTQVALGGRKTRSELWLVQSLMPRSSGVLNSVILLSLGPAASPAQVSHLKARPSAPGPCSAC